MISAMTIFASIFFNNDICWAMFSMLTLRLCGIFTSGTFKIVSTQMHSRYSKES